jgi:hypothetical protein
MPFVQDLASRYRYGVSAVREWPFIRGHFLLVHVGLSVNNLLLPHSTRGAVAKIRYTTPQLLAVDLANTLAIAIESLSTTSSAPFDIAPFDM